MTIRHLTAHRRNPRDDVAESQALELKARRAAKEAEEADRVEQYRRAREIVADAAAAADKARAKADGRDKSVPAEFSSATEYAYSLIDLSRRDPTSREKVALAMNAAASAGLLTRGMCDFCRRPGAQPFPIPGCDVLDTRQGWSCDRCARNPKGTAGR